MTDRVLTEKEAREEERKKVEQETADILKNANIGLWSIVLNDGPSRFYMDETTAKLVGAKFSVSPEEAYEFWFNRIDSNYIEHVTTTVSKILSGVHAEAIYPYHHPESGIISIRCGGELVKDYEGPGLKIRGYHQDISEYNEKLLEQIQISDAIQKHFFSVIDVDIVAHQVRILSDPMHSLSYIGSNQCRWEQLVIPFASNLTAATRKLFQDTIDLENLEKNLCDKPSVAIEVETRKFGWLRMVFIASSKNDEGTVEKCIFLTELIDEEKRKEEGLILMSNTDSLTGLFNRHAYDSFVAKYDSEGVEESFRYMLFDLNGLKHTNDTLGHDAGDELITGAAQIMKEAIGTFGKVYRIGGDEFAALLNCSDALLDKIVAELEEKQASWKGKIVENVAFAVGVVSAKEMPGAGVSQLEKEADYRMYKEKSLYYKTHR